MQIHRVYLDSNIIIAALGGDSDHQLALKLMEVIGSVAPQPTPPYVTSELTLAEVLVRPMRAQSSLSDFDNALTTSAWLEVAPVSRNVLWGAASMRSQHPALKLPDAIHIATALAERCSHILTADTGLRGEYRILVTHDGEHTYTAPVTIVRPDDDMLTDLVRWQQR